MTKDDIPSILNPYARQLLEDWSSEDARLWVSDITVDGVPESISFETAQVRAEESFQKNVGSNDFLKFNSLSKKEALEAAKDYYINFFVKQASKYLKNVRSEEQIEKEKLEKRSISLGLQGHAAAARWFVMMESTSGILKIGKNDLRTIANAACDCAYPNLNEKLKAAYIGFFVKEAQMLIRSLEQSEEE